MIRDCRRNCLVATINATSLNCEKVTVISAFFWGDPGFVTKSSKRVYPKKKPRYNLACALQTKFLFQHCRSYKCRNDLSKRERGLSPLFLLSFTQLYRLHRSFMVFIIWASFLFAGPFFGPSKVLKLGPSLPYKRCRQVLRGPKAPKPRGPKAPGPRGSRAPRPRGPREP